MSSVVLPTYECEDCGKQYSKTWHLDSHLRECTLSKRSLSQLLDQTKEFWASRKRRRVEADPVAQAHLELVSEYIVFRWQRIDIDILLSLMHREMVTILNRRPLRTILCVPLD